MYKSFVALILLVTSTAVFADVRFVCTAGDQQRTITVAYLSDGPLPCEVRYDKGMGPKVLWSAQNTEGYCESHAKDFVQKQEGWGWTCTRYQGSNNDTNGSMNQ
ncbi:MAG: hypothetical protein P8126_12520 [Gammaproteobacteria bacterium]|jgi:hypothetical protein